MDKFLPVIFPRFRGEVSRSRAPRAECARPAESLASFGCGHETALSDSKGWANVSAADTYHIIAHVNLGWRQVMPIDTRISPGARLTCNNIILDF